MMVPARKQTRVRDGVEVVQPVAEEEVLEAEVVAEVGLVDEVGEVLVVKLHMKAKEMCVEG